MTLENLVSINGFNSVTGKLNGEDWTKYVNSIHEPILTSFSNSSFKKNIFEIGCGSGAFLAVIKDHYKNIAGLDYSKNLVNIANKSLRTSNFYCAEANRTNELESAHDLVLSHSIFQYFPDTDYASEVLKEMYRILKKSCGSQIAILDVGNKELEKNFINHRIEKLGKKEFERLYKETPHQFYHKDFFRIFAKEKGLDIKIIDQSFSNYGNSQYRYNIYLKIKKTSS